MENKDKLGSVEEKMIFMRKAIKERREIAAFHFNDVWCEFADKFHRKEDGKHNRSSTITADFKKIMKTCDGMNGAELTVAKVDQIDQADFGVRNIWSFQYKLEPDKKI